MAHRWKNWAAVCAVLAVAPLAQAQEPQQNSASPSTAQGQSISQGAGTSTSAAQIDELLKQSYDQINIEGRFDKAAETAQQALDLSNKIGDKVRASQAMVYLSAAYGYQGRVAEAWELCQKNVVLARESGDKKALEQALNNAASTAGGTGHYEESLAYFYEVFDLSHEINDRTMQYISLLNIGELYFRSGEPERAEAPLNEALRLAAQLKSNDLKASNPAKKGREMALLNLGGMEMERGRYREALNYYEQVHTSHPESPLWQIAALEGMAEAHEALGDSKQAIELLEQAIPLSQKSATGVQYANLESHLGVNQERLGELEAALSSESHSLSLVHSQGGNLDYEWQIEGRLAHIYRALGQNEQALQHYEVSMKDIERLRSVALNTEEGRAGVLARSRETYADSADLLYGLHREREAFEIAERGRARAFLDVLAVSRAGVTDELTPEQRQREDAILSRISAAQKSVWKEGLSHDEKKKNEAALTLAEQDLDGYRVEIRRNNPRYASVRYPDPISIDRIQASLLDDNTALIEYLVAEPRSLVWVITRDKVITAELPAQKTIEEQAIAYREVFAHRVSALTLHQSMRDVKRLGSRLYGTVFRPIEGAVGAVRNLIIIPDGVLNYLPFEALIGDPTGHTAQQRVPYLVEKFSISYAPSASALVTVRQLNRVGSEPPKSLLAFGDPILKSDLRNTPSSKNSSSALVQVHPLSVPEEYAERGLSLERLPYTRDEVIGIGKLVPSAKRELYLGLNATEDQVKKSKLDDFRFIHFASHGFLDEVNPGRSGILFSRAPNSPEDGILQPNEIMSLKLDADLVTLSACSTGIGKLVHGEGVLGLTRSFFYAGARSVAVSLWNVNDSSTATLMQSFYRNMNRGVAKAEALREAKLNIIHGSQSVWQHPYFWAPFVIEGEWH